MLRSRVLFAETSVAAHSITRRPNQAALRERDGGHRLARRRDHRSVKLPANFY